jgi:acyl carrier protein
MKLAGHVFHTDRRAPPRQSGPAARTIHALVEEFVGEALGLAPGEVGRAARFADDLGVDAFDLLELAVEAEERFGVEIGDEALAEVITVGDLGRCVIEAMRRQKQR